MDKGLKIVHSDRLVSNKKHFLLLVLVKSQLGDHCSLTAQSNSFVSNKKHFLLLVPVKSQVENHFSLTTIIEDHCRRRFK
jgi:hypothetical protein